MSSLIRQFSQALQCLTHSDKSSRASPQLEQAAQMKQQLDNQTAQLQTNPAAFLPGITARRLADGTLLMAPTSRHAAADLAAACLREDIRRVVDLRSAHEKSRGYGSVLDGHSCNVAGPRGVAHFGRVGKEGPLHAVGPHLPAPDSHVRRVEVTLSRNGTTLDRDGRAAPGQVQDLSLIRMPVGSEKAICASRLFDVSVHLAKAGQTQGGTTAFQCADGGHVAATFAAASALLRRHLRGAVSPARMDEAILNECLRIRASRPDVFRTEDLASLRAFADQMLEAERRGELQGLLHTKPLPATLAPAKPPRTVTRPVPQSPARS